MNGWMQKIQEHNLSNSKFYNDEDNSLSSCPTGAEDHD